MNVAFYDALAPHLDPESRAFWEGRAFGRRRVAMFTRGFYRFGVLGRFLGAIHLTARLGGVDFRGLLAARGLEDQRRFFEAEIVPLLDNRIVKFLARRRASLFGLGIPPAQYYNLAADGGGDVMPVLRERIRKLMCDFPIRDNYFAWQAFSRQYDPGPSPSLPPYLEARNFEAVREGAARVTVHNRSLTDVLAETPAGRLQCYVLLDAQDWMADAQLAGLWREITRTAAPGARVIFRTGGAADILPGRLPGDVLARWTYDAAESAAGFAADRSAIYGGFHLYRLAA